MKRVEYNLYSPTNEGITAMRHGVVTQTTNYTPLHVSFNSQLNTIGGKKWQS